MVIYMTIINTFLQKRKLRESGHGIYPVIAAYVLSFLLLVIGSDIFYNVKSKAGRMEIQSDEEKQVLEVPDSNEGRTTDQAAAYTASTGEQAAAQTATVSRTDGLTEQSRRVAEPDDTNWLLGFAMNDEEYSHMMAQLGTSEVFAEEDGEDEISSFSLPKANLVEKKTTRNFKLTNEDIKILEQIVEAEATGEDIIGKILVANVIFNRMESEEFPDTVKEVVFQKVGDKYQFSPIADKRYWQVEVSEETREAVKRAISGEDYSQGALYFMARKLARKSSIKWFDSNLELLFKHGEHEFFK